MLDVSEVAGHSQFASRRAVTVATHPREGEVRQLAPAFLAGMSRPRDRAVLPVMAQTDTEHLLKEAGVDGDTVARWVAKGVVA